MGGGTEWEDGGVYRTVYGIWRHLGYQYLLVTTYSFKFSAANNPFLA
jgi:hypothetical protein